MDILNAGSRNKCGMTAQGGMTGQVGVTAQGWLTAKKIKNLFLSCLSFYVLGHVSLSIALDNPPSTVVSIASNPAAVNVLTGSGVAQRYFENKLGIQNDHGIRIGGAILGDANDLFAGGIPDAERWTYNGLLLLGLSADTEKLMGWRGGVFDVEFLQFNGQSTNKQAGTVQGYNSLPGAPPLNRSELYKLWFRQELFDQKLFIRIGKSVTSLDFGNVVQPIPLIKGQPDISSVTQLLYTPIFVNASMLGVMPGYYNSAYGVTVNFVPVHNWYVSYGVFDGNQAQGKQTGLTGPTFNGSYFNIAETGLSWLLGKNNLPGHVGVGAWNQSGLIKAAALSETGASGYYLFGTQRLWYRDPEVNDSGISGFYQYGENNSTVMNMKEYLGAGFTAFGLVPHRINDSIGIGSALSWLNQTTFTRRTELMFQTYYQAQIISGIYLEPALSYIPTPGAQANLNPAWAGTLRAIISF